MPSTNYNGFIPVLYYKGKCKPFIELMKKKKIKYSKPVRKNNRRMIE